MSKRVYVGMSGGVDSSVAALLLYLQGYVVTGFTLDLWDRDNNDVKDAAKVCEQIGIPHIIIDLRSTFKEKVVDVFLSEYKYARTPNPCVICNKYIKFGAMLDYIRDKADYIATGHYAKVVFDENIGRYHFEKSVDEKKDQTYMFYTLTQEQISKIIMPLGNYKKENIRTLAEENGFVSAKKPDSQDICFLEGMELEQFIRKNAPDQLADGNIIDKNGKILGRHNGISCYTIGQRRGLGVPSDKKIYVTNIDYINNTVVLDDEKYIFSNTLFAENVNFQPFEKLEKQVEVTAKIRYAAKPAKAVISPENGGVRVEFETPQRAITPGQSVVFYNGDILVGGGIICT